MVKAPRRRGRFGARIAGTGSFLPDRVVTNDEIADVLGVTPEWIRKRTGVRERRIADAQAGASDLAAPAARSALDRAGLEGGDVDAIVLATLSPDQTFPGSAVLVQDRLGLADRAVPAFEIHNQCSGFLFALEVADALVCSGKHRVVLVIGTELHSAALDWSPRGRDLASLFGDGAGAVVVQASEGEADAGAIRWIGLGSDGRFADAICTPAPGSSHRPAITEEMVREGLTFPRMEGLLTTKWAGRRLQMAVESALESQNLKGHDLDHLIPHQANLRIIDKLVARLDLPPERCHTNLERLGNLSSASIPVALDEASRTGLLGRGDRVVLAAFGAGFSWGSAFLEW